MKCRRCGQDIRGPELCASCGIDMGCNVRKRQVEEFHHNMDQPVLDKPQVPPEDRVRLRLRLIAEEFFELLYAANIYTGTYGFHQEKLFEIIDKRDPDFRPLDLPAFADALADLDYVIEGTRLEFGIDGPPIADAVHAANMAKAGGKVDANGKVQKPEGWEPPDIAGELRKQGWEG